MVLGHRHGGGRRCILLAAFCFLLGGGSAAKSPGKERVAQEAERRFLKLLLQRNAAEAARKSAFEALKRTEVAPSSRLRREIGRAWDKVRRELVRKITTHQFLRKGRRLFPLLTQHRERLKGVLAQQKASREAIDGVLKDVTSALESLYAALERRADFQRAKSRYLEFGQYAGWAGVMRRFSTSLGEAVVQLEVMRVVLPSTTWPVFDFNHLWRGLIDPQEAECIAYTNLHRARLGLRPCEIDLRLVVASRKHSEEMARKNYFGHDSPTAKRRTPWQRAKREGVAAAAENICIAKGGKSAFRTWLYSRPHHTNMIAEGHAAVGIGNWKTRWTQLFGPLSILRTYRRYKELTYARLRYEAGLEKEKILKLALWCLAEGLRSQAEDEAERVLVLDPNEQRAQRIIERLRGGARP